MALIEAVFKRSASNRTLTFQTISEEAKVSPFEVEHLVMKALRHVHAPCHLMLCLHLTLDYPSLKLIKGTLDQVEEKAHIHWVQPRVLSKDQIGELAERLTTWCDKLQKVETFTQTEMLANA